MSQDKELGWELNENYVVTFDPPLTQEQGKLVDDIQKVGQGIKDRSSFKQLLAVIFFSEIIDLHPLLKT